MNIPNLMPYQFQPFNGDDLVSSVVLSLKSKFNLVQAIELGTCLGGTTNWLSENFDIVTTIEINDDFRKVAIERYNNIKGNVNFILGDSVNELPKVIPDSDNYFIFIDSHWLSHCPMIDELKIIAASKTKPVILIHDFFNPNNEEFGFDSYNGQPFTFEWIKPHIDSIYGEGGYLYHYNIGLKEESAKRGVIFIFPKEQ